jgi:adenylate cyclase
MALQKEIERKYLVRKELLPPLTSGRRMAQGYLSFQPTVRVRTEAGADGARHAYLTIKSYGLVARDEFQYEIPYAEAEALLNLAHGTVITKTRYDLPVEGRPELTWEVDVFEGENAGLITAEIELPSADCDFPRPEWLADDVSDQPAYKNAMLAQRPYTTWTSGGA